MVNEFKNSMARASASLRMALRKELFSGNLIVGDLLPSVRQLSAQFQLAPKTVHRALQELEKEGLISSEPRKGFRVLSRSNDPRRGCPVASVLDSPDWNNTSPLHLTLKLNIERILNEQSFSLLSVFCVNKTIDSIIEQIKIGRAWGVLLDTVNVPLLAKIEKMGIPAVMIDAWVEDAPFDVVLQDNYQGGYKAAKYLLKQGYKKIAWVGPIGSSGISRERFGGASAALSGAGRYLTKEMCFECDHNNPDAEVLKILTAKNRPDAIIALWREIAISIANTAKKLNLKIGTDFGMVGWSTLDKYEAYSKFFEENNTPPTIVWDPAEMAQTAINRLSERWRNPQMPVLRLHVGTNIRI